MSLVRGVFQGCAHYQRVSRYFLQKLHIQVFLRRFKPRDMPQVRDPSWRKTRRDHNFRPDYPKDRGFTISLVQVEGCRGDQINVQGVCRREQPAAQGR